MKTAKRLTFDGKSLVVTAVLACCFSTFPSVTSAQSYQGQNAVYNSSNGRAASPGFIDASMFATSVTSPNSCSVLNYVLVHIVQSTYPNGAVIDARGLPGGTGTSMTCTTANPSPWAGITTPSPSAILLPATGSNPIVIPSTWSLPPNTRLIGEGDGIISSGFTLGTTIQAANGFSGAMIQFGPSLNLCFPPGSASICTGISVENLNLDGEGRSINGIVNQFAGNQSYVDHVSLYRILGTGLSLTAGANQSGPYSNITYDLGGESGTSSTICANLNGLTGTRGIRGLSCISENNIPPAAVLLDSSNNSIEDVRIPTNRITLDLYAQAGMPNKRLAQSKLVQMVLNKGEAPA